MQCMILAILLSMKFALTLLSSNVISKISVFEEHRRYTNGEFNVSIAIYGTFPVTSWQLAQIKKKSLWRWKYKYMFINVRNCSVVLSEEKEWVMVRIYVYKMLIFWKLYAVKSHCLDFIKIFTLLFSGFVLWRPAGR